MSAAAPTYDLVLLLDPESEDSVRAKLVSDARNSITSQGELLRHDEWGSRALTYPIHRRSAAEYHLMQFHANSPELLRGLDRSLSIADDVLRFRIVKLRPGTPEPPELRGAAPRRAEAAQSGAPEQAAADEPQRTGDGEAQDAGSGELSPAGEGSGEGTPAGEGQGAPAGG